MKMLGKRIKLVVEDEVRPTVDYSERLVKYVSLKTAMRLGLI